MTTIDTHVGAATQGSSSSFVATVGQWVTSSDHKKIGRLFIGWSLVHAIEIAVLGVLFGFERVSPASLQIFNGDSVVQWLAYNSHLQVLGLLAPLFIGIAVAVVPMQVGARSIALPRVAQLGFWSWLFGCGLVLWSLVANGGPGGGNTDMVDLFLLGTALTIAGIVAAAASVATTVLTTRAAGMTLDRVPAFSWSALVGSVATVLSLPVAVGTIIYLYVDNTHARVAFDGNKGVGTWLNWLYKQPLTFVLVVMALGVVAEIAPVVARVRQPQRPVVLGGLGLVSVAALGAVTQNQHLLDTNGSAMDKLQSTVLFLAFNGLPLLGVLVTIAASVLAFRSGKPRINAAFSFALLGALMILIGAVGNLVATVGRAGLIGTSFEDAVTTYLVYGSVMAGLGALTHWAPKLWGRVLDDQKVQGLSAIAFIGTILATFPLLIAGFTDQPTSALYGFDYDGPVALWNGLSAVGAALFTVAVLGFIALLVAAVRGGEQATDDPWDAHTLEWSIPSPAPVDNFAAIATVNSAEPVLDAKPSQEARA